jgi:hypothetical protein
MRMFHRHFSSCLPQWGKIPGCRLNAEYRWEAVFSLSSEDVENMPVALKDVLVEEADTAVTDAHCIGRPFAEVLAVKEVVLEFIFGELLRALVEGP